MTHWHEALSARGASFDGSVVSGFGDPAGELAAARDAAVLCDLAPVSSLRIAGPDAEAFLQGQFTNDVSALAPGATQYSAWCSPKGRVLANFLLRRIDNTSFEVLLPGVLFAPVRKRLGMFVLRAKVALDDASAESARIGIAGPAAREAVEALGVGVPPIYGSVLLPGGALFQVPGARFLAIIAPESAAPCWDRLAGHARPAGFECWRWLTIRAGVPVILPATQDHFIPQAINLDALAGVSFQKGCYTGQEIVARTQYLGRLKERTILAHSASSAIAPGARLFSRSFGDQPCGSVLNAASAPDGGTDLLAVCQIAASANADLHLGTADGAPLSLRPLPYELPASSGAARVHRSTLNRP